MYFTWIIHDDICIAVYYLLSIMNSFTPSNDFIIVLYQDEISYSKQAATAFLLKDMRGTFKVYNTNHH